MLYFWQLVDELEKYKWNRTCHSLENSISEINMNLDHNKKLKNTVENKKSVSASIRSTEKRPCNFWERVMNEVLILMLAWHQLIDVWKTFWGQNFWPWNTLSCLFWGWNVFFLTLKDVFGTHQNRIYWGQNTYFYQLGTCSYFLTMWLLAGRILSICIV